MLWSYIAFLFISVVAAAPGKFNKATHRNNVALASTGATYRLGGIDYFAHPQSVGTLNTSGIHRGEESAVLQHLPLTVIVTDNPKFSQATLERTIESYTSRDDVFQESFLNVIYVRYNGSGDRRPMGNFADVQNRYNSSTFIFSGDDQQSAVSYDADLAPGPYFLDLATGGVHRAYLLYSDDQEAFVSGLVEQPNGQHDVLSASVAGAQSATIGVPSRLYSEPSQEKPLAGYRFGAKDIFDIHGMKTSCGNRAYYSLYPPANETAPAIQMLLDKGAVLVGKMRTSQFANGEIATADWVDYPEPFNPRGDGYQDTSSSSSGPAAGVASYGWLDFAIGSDTGGSVRCPAGAQGIYGNRPSYGAVSLKHVMPLCSSMDTAGILSREANLWRSVARVLYPEFQEYNEYPSKIIYPEEYFSIAIPGTPAGDLVHGFVSKLERFLGTQKHVVNLGKLWESTKPSSDLSSFDVTFNKTYTALISLDQINLLGNAFISDYAESHDGRKPFLDPSTQVRWDWGRSQPAGTLEEAMRNKTIFKDWFSNNVVGNDSNTCSDSVFIYPYTVGDTVYRNVYRGPPDPPLGFSNVEVACFSDTPDHLVPIGEVPYNSTITERVEYLPVTVALVASKGCDMMLYNLIVDLERAGIISPVKTGRNV